VQYDGEKGVMYAQRWTWAVPLELIYMTPLTKWNPRQLNVFSDEQGMAPTGPGNNRTGSTTDSSLAYNGVSTRFDYKTPVEFFEGYGVGNNGDPADTSARPKGVLGPDGKLQLMVASGTWSSLPSIGGGVGKVRQRYPVAPVHWHGSTGFKETRALTRVVDTALELEGGVVGVLGRMRQSRRGIRATLSVSSSAASVPSHIHDFTLAAWQAAQLESGGIVEVSTTTEEGHSHRVKVRRDATTGGLVLLECDSTAGECWDGHDKVDAVSAA